MKTELDFLKGAKDSTNPFYVLRDGWLYTIGAAMGAGVPFSANFEGMIPADELEGAVGRMSTEPKIERRETVVVLRAGRLRSTILCMDVDGAPPYPKTELERNVWVDLPPDFCNALGMAAAFTADEGRWQVGVYVNDDVVQGCNNFAAIEVTVPDLTFPAVNIPRESAAYLARTQPTQYRTQPGGLLFRWPNGRWVRVSGLSYMPPDGLTARIFDRAGTDAPIPLTEAWHTALGDAGALSDKIEIRADRLVARGERALSEIAIKTGLTPEHVSLWQYKVLGLMLPVATRWNPNKYPDPTPFVAPNVRGVIMGLRV